MSCRLWPGNFFQIGLFLASLISPSVYAASAVQETTTLEEISTNVSVPLTPCVPVNYLQEIAAQNNQKGAYLLHFFPFEDLANEVVCKDVAAEAMLAPSEAYILARLKKVGLTGNSAAAFLIGHSLGIGFGGRKDPLKARVWLNRVHGNWQTMAHFEEALLLIASEVELYRKSALQSIFLLAQVQAYPPAEHFLASLYLQGGFGVSSNEARYTEWIERAIAHKDPNAFFMRGYQRLQRKHYQDAFSDFEKAASFLSSPNQHSFPANAHPLRLHHHEAAYLLAHLLFAAPTDAPDNVPRDAQSAKRIWQQLSAENYCRATTELGRLERDDPVTALSLFEEAFRKGCDDAAVDFYQVVTRTPSINDIYAQQAIQLIQQASDRDHARSRAILGMQHLLGNGARVPIDPAKGEKLLFSAVLRHPPDPYAEFILAHTFGPKPFSPEPNERNIGWWRLLQHSVAQGYAPAAVLLGEHLLSGMHCPASPKQAIALFERYPNHIAPLMRLGELYMNGYASEGFTLYPNYDKAKELFLKARTLEADSPIQKAVLFYYLGRIYQYGLGSTKVNLTRAFSYLSESSTLGFKAAQQHLEEHKDVFKGMKAVKS